MHSKLIQSLIAIAAASTLAACTTADRKTASVESEMDQAGAVAVASQQDYRSGQVTPAEAGEYRGAQVASATPSKSEWESSQQAGTSTTGQQAYGQAGTSQSGQTAYGTSQAGMTQSGLSTSGQTVASMDQMCSMYTRMKNSQSTEEREILLTEMSANMPGGPSGANWRNLRESCE